MRGALERRKLKNGGDPGLTYAVGFEAGIRIGPFGWGLPVVPIDLKSSGVMIKIAPIKVSGSNWKPLLGLLPTFEALDPRINVDVTGSLITASATATGTVDALWGYLRFENFKVAADISYDFGKSQLVKGLVDLNTKVQVGGPKGFVADVSTKVDIAAKSAVIKLEHKGGWNPITGLAKFFKTPRFTADLKLNKDNKFLYLTANASWSESVVIIPQVLSLEQRSDGIHPTISVSLEKFKKTMPATTKITT